MKEDAMGLRRTVALISLVVVGCAGPASSSPSPSETVPPSATIESPSSTTASPAMPGETPPDANLAAEGGDPVTAQLGTYTWRETGSDSPWLHGAPIAIGAGEPLTVTLEPAIATESWRARLVPATADGPAGAVILGQGAGPLVFAAPAPGGWTVEVAVVFADALGEASYFWRLEVN
jgi:hypothetical protein